MQGYFITGTDTGVGKTIATAVLGKLFQKQGKKVGVMKPVASGAVKIDDQLVSEDARYLKAILKLPEPLAIINPICLEHPLAPKVAADHGKEEINMAVVKAAYMQYEKINPDILLVEGVGGVMVPLKHDYLVLDMIRDFGFPVIIVSRPNLGTINHTILTTSILKQERIPIAGIIFNYSKESKKGMAEKTNPKEINRLSGIPIVGEIPYQTDINNLNLGEIAENVDAASLL